MYGLRLKLKEIRNVVHWFRDVIVLYNRNEWYLMPSFENHWRVQKSTWTCIHLENACQYCLVVASMCMEACSSQGWACLQPGGFVRGFHSLSSAKQSTVFELFEENNKYPMKWWKSSLSELHCLSHILLIIVLFQNPWAGHFAFSASFCYSETGNVNWWVYGQHQS